MTSKYKVHFIGVGGIGISALARYFLAQNWAVSGSDTLKSPIIKELQVEGLKAKIGHKKANIRPDLDVVVMSLAVPTDNIEVKTARNLDIPVLTYPQSLGDITKNFETIAIAGAHGKSTTTAMASLIFKAAGLDPTVIVGTKLKEFDGKNFHLGKGKHLIIEADEYKDAFLNYHPQAILITNIDREHMDYFKNLADVEKSFLKFINNLGSGGTLILNKDDTSLSGLKKKIQSLKPNADIVWFSLKDKNIVKQIAKVIKIPGAHNLSNALGAYKLAESLGVNPKIILKAISDYRGSWRRMEYKGRFMKAQVYDDYAHHPTEIKATLGAFKEKFPKAKLICVFQPHQLKRLKFLFDDFTKCFEAADELILIDTFAVSGRDKLSDNVNSEKLVRKIVKRKTSISEVVYLPYPKQLKQVLKTELEGSKEPAVIVMMGAGDVVNLTPTLLR